MHAINNNLALVASALCSCPGDYSAAIGDAVAAGWDTDCNGATVGGLCGLTGMKSPDHWTRPWNGRIAVGLAGHSELRLDDDDDTLEIFIDEDFSGGDHQYNHNAFAYHVSLDSQAVDIGTDRRRLDLSEHVESRWQQRTDGIVWELAIGVYPERYQEDGSLGNTPVAPVAGKVIGLMLAYCDNDGSEFRENFVGKLVLEVLR
ncbi:MAG: ADP-ribosylglycohydrolase family protein [Gammaproteobacteria bacterium]|nr:ADP-ribosylglycohydrolase family protein [Gammaproteobacteria bacterium]